jgi:uncharacterized RDD family membrane protein YckC
MMPYCERCGSENPRGSQYCSSCGAPIESHPVHYRADLGERLIAWFIDFVILSLALGAITFFARIAPGSPPLPWTHHLLRWGPFGLLHVKSLAFFVYWAFMDYVYGRSLGKMVMGLRVADIDGGRIDQGQAAVESFGKAFLLPFDLMAGLALYPSRSQRLSSHLSGTVVVRDSPECCPVELIRI